MTVYFIYGVDCPHSGHFGAMQVNKGDNNTKKQFGDIEHFHLEFKLPLEPNSRGQGRGNSGVYFAGQIEVQVLDSFGLVHTSGDCAGLYNVARARVNECLPTETWRSGIKPWRMRLFRNCRIKIR